MYVGLPVKRVEDKDLLTGSARFLCDIKLPNMLYAWFVRSPYSHARIRSIDPTDATRAGGVLRVFTSREIREVITSLREDVESPGGGSRGVSIPALASGKVVYQGEPVAMVVAEDQYLAEDAAELVNVDYDPLEPVVSVDKALSGSVLVHEELGSNVASSGVVRSGDVEKALGESRFRVSVELVENRVLPVPMETRGVIASYDGNKLTVYSSTQWPFNLRTLLAKSLGLREESVRVIQPATGGGFGQKINFYQEELAVAKASIELGRPVKWVESRLENLTAATHGRDVRAKLEAAADEKGVVKALRGDVVLDVGAYLTVTAVGLASGVASMLTGPYRVRNVLVHHYSVYTNKAPIGPYRGAGRPEASFFIERVMDVLADELGLDPVEVRLRNMIKPDEMPYENPGGIKYDSGDYPGLLREAVDRLGYREALSWAEKERSRGRRVGVGLSVYVEITGFGPLETAAVRLRGDGVVEVISGSAPHGQGDATAFAQLVASELGVGIDRVRVVWGDTELLEKGGYTAGSRTLTLGGSAVIEAARRLKDMVLEHASKLLGVGKTELRLAGGFVVWGDKRISLGDLVTRVGGSNGRLEAYAEYHTDEVTCPYGAYMAVVEVDEETGVVRVLEVSGLDDLGRVVNPLLVEGQVYGGVLQSVGQALYENAVYDDRGSLLTSTLGDYGVPGAPEAPLRVRHETKRKPSMSRHPTGSKGVGEAPTIGSLPAIIRAIEDAVGARITKSHVTPEDVKRLLTSRPGPRPRSQPSQGP